ncbi:hypothetical protein KSF78_0009672 [Schistosoma japonicum]|nr:hypothetical protein KSF78_0009672 [Schistosoma japonicum]
MGKKVVHDIPTYFFIHNSSPPITYTHNISPSSLYGEEGCARHSHLFFSSNNSSPPIKLTPTTSRHHLYMGKKVVHDIPTYFFIHNSSPPINLHPQTSRHHLYMGKKVCARHSHLFFHPQLITANQLTPTTSRHQSLYGEEGCARHSPPIFSSTTHHRQSTYTHNISPSSLYGGRRLCTTFPPIFSSTTHHRQSTYTHNISPSSLIWGRRLCTTFPPIFSSTTHHPPINLHPQHLAIIFIWGRRLCTTFPPIFSSTNSSPPINLHTQHPHPQHLAIIFIWGRRLCTTFPPIFSSTTHHRQSTYTHNISPSSLYGEEGCARHSHLFFHPQLITANQLTPTTSRHHLYMGKKVVHDIPTYFFIHNSSPPINLHPQHLAIIFIWGRRLCTTFPPIFSSTTHHRQSTYTHNISPSSLYGEEGCARHSHLFFHPQLITANQLTPTTSRHHLYMGKKVVHDIPTYFFIHNSSPPINLHPQHLAIIFIWGRRLCTTFPPIFSSTTHHRQSTYTHNISPSSLYGEEGCARHSHLFFHPQLITANQLTPTTSRHHLYMGKKVVHDIPTYFFIHNSSPPINLHPQHLAIIFIWGRRLCTTFPPIFSCTTHHRQSTYTHNISPSSLYGEEGCARHSHLFFHPQLITANQLTPTTSRHHLYMGKKVVHDIPTYFFIHNSSPPINLHPQHLAIIFIWGRRLCTTFPPIFSSTTHHRQSTYTHNISPSSLYGEEGCARHSHLFFHPQLITANQLTPTTSRHHLYMGKKVVHDIPTYFFIHNSSPPINLHPQHLAIIFIWGRRLCTTFPPIFSSTTHHRQSTYTHNISPSSLYGEEGCARHSHLFFHPQLITANQLTPTTSRHHLYMGKKVVHDIPTYFFIHNSSPPINLHPQHLAIIFIWGRRLCTTFPPIFSSTTHHRQSTYTHNISPSSLYGEEGCARHSHLFFHPQLITANQLTPTTSRHHLYMGKKVVHDIPTYFFIHNSSPPINLHPQHLAIIFIWGRRLCTTFPPIFSSTTHHRQSTYTHNISPSSLYGEEGCARHSHLFFHPQLITANQLTPTTSRHHLYMGKKVVHDIPTYFFIHNSSPPINLHPQHLAIIFIWGRRLCTTFPPIFSSTTHHRQSTYTHNISPSSLYGEEGCARHSHLFFHPQLITANQLTPTTSRHHLYMGKKVVHDIPTYFFIHNSSPPINLHPQHLAIIFIWGRRLCTTFPPIFSSTTHHRQSTYTHNISPSSLYGEEGCARHSHLFFHPQLITANQLTPTTSRHHLYMGKKVVHDIPTYFFIHNSSPPINLHPQHLAIIFIWGRRLCTTFPPIFSSTTHHRQSTYTHNISPSSLYGEEGCARHSHLFFHPQLITANQLTPTTSRHHLYMGKKVVHDIPTYFFIHNSSPPINLHPQHLAIIFIWGRRLCTTFPPIFSSTTHHRQSTYTHNISPSSLYGEEGCARHSHLFFHPQLITANQLTPTTSRHHLYMGKKVVHDIPTYFFIHNSSPPINLHPQHLAIIFIWGRRLCTTFPPIFSSTTHHRQSTYTHNISPSSLYGEEGCARHSHLFFHPQLITANQLTPTTSRHHLYMGKKVVHDIPTYFFIHNSSPPINLHPQHLAIIFIWGRRLCTTFPPIFSSTTHHRQSTYTHNISPSSLYGEEGCARHSHLFFHPQLITANQLTPTTSRHHLYMGKKVVHDIPTYFFIHNSSPPINLHPQHLAIIFIWGRRLCTTFPPIFSSTTHHRQSTYTHNISPSSLYGEEGCARHSHLFFHPQLITANQLTPTTSRHHLYMGKKVVHDIPTYFFIHNSSPPINLHPQHLAIIFIWGRRLCTTFPPIFSSTTHHRQSTYTHNISPSSLYGEEGCARHSHLFFHPQLITANQLTPTTSRHHLYMGKKVVHDIPTYFFIHNSSPPINLHPQHLAIIFIWGRRLCTTFPPIFSSTTHHRQSTYTHNISPSSLYGEEGCARHSHLFFHPQLITANQLTPTTSRHHLYMGKKKVVHDIPTYFFIHNSSPPINLHPQHLAIIFIWGRRLCTTFPPIFSSTTHHRQSTYTHNISPSSLYGEEGCARHSHLFFHPQLITANQLTPTTSRHHLYMGKKVVHDIPTYFFIHNSSPPINLHPQHLAIIFIWGRRLCTTFPPIFSSTTHHRQSTYTHNISPSSLYGEEGCARHSHLFFHPQLITANQLTPTTSRHHLYMGKKVVHDIPTYFFIHNSSPPINLHPQHLAIIFIWGRRLCTTFPPIFSSTTHHRQSTYTHNISPSSLYGEEGCARHSHLFFHPQLITANQLTPTTSRHHLYMGKKVVHDIPTYFFIHNSSPPINLHPQHLAIIFIWGRRLCTTFPPIFSSTTHHRQSTYTHNISPSSLYGEEGCARHSHLFFHPQLITANQLTPTTSRHHLYMGKKVVHDIPTYFFIHNSSPPINLHPQHLAIIFIWGRRLCTTFPPIFSSTTHHRQSTYTHNISPSSLYGEEGCARHSHLFFIHNSSPPINLHPQHLAIIFIWGRRLCTTFPPIFSSTTHHRQSTYTHNISPSSLYGEEGCARHSHLFFHPQLITANQLTPTTSRHHLYMGKKVVHDIPTYFFIHNSSPPINLHPQHLAIIFIWGRRLCTTFPPIFSSTTHHRQSTYTHNISPSSLYGEEGCARHSHLFFHPQLITANQLTPTTSRHHLYMGKKVVHDIPTYFFIHNSSPPINLHPQHLAIIFIWGRRLCTTFPPIFSSTTHHRQSTYTHNISPSSLYGEEGCARHSHLFFHPQLITANQLTPTTSRHHLYMGKKVVHDIPTYFFIHNSSPPINLHPQHLAIIFIWGRRLCTTFPPIFSSTTHHRQSTYTHNISPSSLYGEEGCARHSHLFFHPQLITANQLTPTTSRHHLYMGKKVVHDIPTYFFIHNSSPPINLHPQHLAIIFIWGRRLCTTFPPIFSSTTHHRQSTYTHNISPSSLYGEEGCARHSHLFFHPQLITANQLTPTTSRHHLYMGKKVVHDIPTYFFIHNSSPPINLHPQHLAIIFIWGRRLCTTFPPIFSSTTHHRQSTYTHNISPSSLYGEEGCARHSHLFFHPQLITANQLTPTTSRHHLYMGKKVVHDIPTYFFIHNSSPPINLHPQHLAIIFIWGRRLCTTFPPIFSSTTHHRQSTYTHNISPSSLYGEEGCARHSHLFFHPQLITANQLTPTTSRHHLYMGKKVVHDIPTYFFIHNSSPPINLHPQHLAIIFIWGRRLCTTFPPIFSSTTHHRQSTYTHNISPSSLYGEEGCARHSHLFFHPQLITANQLTPTTSRHHLYMGKKVVHDIPTYFFIHNSSPPINLHPQHLAIIFIWGRRLCTTFPPIFSSTTHHRQSTYTHNISPSSLYGEEGCARHSHLFFIHNSSPPINLHPQHLAIIFIWGRRLCTTFPPIFHPQLITANQLTPTTSRHHLYMGKKVVHDIPTYFFIHNSSPPINLHPQHLAIIFIWGRRLCTTFPPIFSSTTHHRQSTYTHNISPSSLYGEEGCARHSHLFFHPQLITANQLTPTTSRHHLYMGKKVVHDIPTYFFIHNSSPPINLHPQHLAIIFIWGRRLCTTFPPIFSSTTHHRQSTYTHNISPSSLYGEEGCARHSHLFFHPQLITANQLTPTTSRHHLYMGKKVVHDIPTYFFIHNSSPPINLHPQHLAIIFIWGRRLCTTFPPIFSSTTHHRQSTYTHNISPSSLYGEEGCARHSHLFFHPQLITANQLTPTTSRHHLYMGKKVVHDIPTYFFIHNSSPPINLHPQHLAIIFIWGRRLCTTFPPIFSSTTHHRQSTYTHNISPSSLYGEEGCARHSHLFFHPQLITANQLTPTTSRHHLYMGKKVVHDIPTYFFIHNSSPPINLHPQHLAIIFIWGRRLCTTFPPIFSSTTHHRQSTYTHNISPSSLYGEEGCARHSHLFFHPQLITANQLTPTTSRHHLYMGKKVVHDIPTYFFIHNSSPPINLHPQHLAIIFIWGRRLCTTFPPIFSSTTHHRQSTYTHNISPSSLYGEEGCARHSHLFFHPQLITANQLTPTTSRHHLYMGKKVVHDIPTYFFIHNSSPPINLHPQHLAIIFIWGRRLCTTFPPIFHPQLITANQLTPTTSRHHLYMGKKVVHDIPTYFFIHNSSPPINLHPQHLAIIFIWGRRLCTTFPPIFHPQLITANQLTPTTYRHHLYMGKKVVHDIPTYFFIHNSLPTINHTHNISPSSLYGVEGCARHCPLFVHPQLITANQLTPTTSRHHLYMGKKVVHDIPTYFFIHNSSPPINLHPQHLAIIFIWGRRLCTTFPPIFSSTTHHRQSTYTHNISPSSLYGEEGCARHSHLFFHPQLITANQLTPTTSRHHLYMGKKVVHDIPTYFSSTTHHRQSTYTHNISPSSLYGEEGCARHSHLFFMHNSSPPINLHPQHLAIIFIWGRRLCTTFPPIFSSTTHHRQSTYTHNISPSSLYGEEGCARHSHLFFHPQLITANQLTPTTSRHHLYMGKKVVHDIPTYFFIHNSSPPINLHPQHLAIIFIWGRRLCTTFPPIFSCTTHHRQSTYTHNISPSSLYGEEGCARHSHLFFIHNSSPPINLHPQHLAIIFIWGRRLCTTFPPIFSSTTHHRQSTYTHNISPSSLYGEEGCARHSTYFFIHNSSPPINLHPQHLAIIFIWEEGCARHSHLFFHPQLITANQLTPTTSRHHLYMGKKVVHDIPTYFSSTTHHRQSTYTHNISPSSLYGEEGCARHSHLFFHPQPHHRQSTYTHNISPSSLYGEEGCARHSTPIFHPQLIFANQHTPTTYRHHLYMGKKVVHDIAPYFSSTTHHRQSTYTHNISPSSYMGKKVCTTFPPIFHPQLIFANQHTPTTYHHHLYMGKKVVHDIAPYFSYKSSPPINLHPQHLAIIFIWGRRLCTTFPPIFSSTTHHPPINLQHPHISKASSLLWGRGCTHSP